jgi:hypothetical protein
MRWFMQLLLYADSMAMLHAAEIIAAVPCWLAQ